MDSWWLKKRCATGYQLEIIKYRVCKKQTSEHGKYLWKDKVNVFLEICSGNVYFETFQKYISRLNLIIKLGRG